MKNCATCKFCKYIHTPQVTGNDIDYVCERKGSTIDDISIKNCDEMYIPNDCAGVRYVFSKA